MEIKITSHSIHCFHNAGLTSQGKSHIAHQEKNYEKTARRIHDANVRVVSI